MLSCETQCQDGAVHHHHRLGWRLRWWVCWNHHTQHTEEDEQVCGTSNLFTCCPLAYHHSDEALHRHHRLGWIRGMCQLGIIISFRCLVQWFSLISKEAESWISIYVLI